MRDFPEIECHILGVLYFQKFGGRVDEVQGVQWQAAETRVYLVIGSRTNGVDDRISRMDADEVTLVRISNQSGVSPIFFKFCSPDKRTSNLGE